MGVLTAPKYDWFSPEDFDRIATLIAGHPRSENIVIVGGQSLVGWATLLNVDVPIVETPYLTQDLDLLCTKQDAAWLAEQLHVPLCTPGPDDATCQTAKLTYRPDTNRGLLVIDFLGVILGVDSKVVMKMAVPVTYSGHRLQLLHPLLCLRSRLANLFTLSQKRDGNGIAQAHVAVSVVEAYLRQLSSDHHLMAMQSVRKIIDIAGTIEGRFCFDEWGVDPLIAINQDVFKGRVRVLGKYRYQNPLRRVFYRREIDQARKEGLVYQPRLARGADQRVHSVLMETLSAWGHSPPDPRARN